MSVFKVPREQADSFLVIDSVDLTEHIRIVDWEEDQPTIDVGTVNDPSATAPGRLSREMTIEFLNSFSDGTTDGLYDKLVSLADGSEKAATFAPYGSGTTKPSWAFNTEIGFAPIGTFETDAAVTPSLTIPVRQLQYTKATIV